MGIKASVKTAPDTAAVIKKIVIKKGRVAPTVACPCLGHQQGAELKKRRGKKKGTRVELDPKRKATAWGNAKTPSTTLHYKY